MSVPVTPYWVGNVAFLHFPARPLELTADDVLHSFLLTPSRPMSGNLVGSKQDISVCQLSGNRAPTVTGQMDDSVVTPFER